METRQHFGGKGEGGRGQQQRTNATSVAEPEPAALDKATVKRGNCFKLYQRSAPRHEQRQDVAL